MRGIDIGNYPSTHKLTVEVLTLIIDNKAVMESTGTLDDIKEYAVLGFAQRYHISPPSGVYLKWIPVAWDKNDNAVLLWAENTDVRISISKKEVSR